MTVIAAGTVSDVAPSSEATGRGPRVRSLLRRVNWLAVRLGALLVAVNAAAIGGQAAFFRDHLIATTGPALAWPAALGVSLVLESIGVWLAAMAHAARMDYQFAGLRQAGAYAIGAVAAALNWSHWSPTWRPNALAVTFGAFSLLSPWLWSIYSRHMAKRKRRHEQRPPSRAFWHPVKYLRVVSYAAWHGIGDLDAAVVAWELEQLAGIAPVSGSAGRTPAEWVALAEEAKAKNPRWSWAKVADHIGCSDRHLRTCRNIVDAERKSITDGAEQ